MPFDGIVLKGAVGELNSLLSGGRIEKIFQTERDEIVLVCHAFSDHYRLLISASPANPRIHLTTEKKPNPVIAPPFCMVLRKYLQGARIVGICQSGCDRVVTLTAEMRNEMGDLEEKKLVVEIMGRHSNVILLNGSGVIHDAIKHIDQDISRVREIMPARHYVAPPAQEKLYGSSVTIDALGERKGQADQEIRVHAWLLEILSGFSPVLCKCVCTSAEIDPNTHLGALTLEETERLFREILAVCQEIEQETFYPAILGDEKDFHCVRCVSEVRGISRKFSTVNRMIDEFYTGRDREARLRERKSGLEKVLGSAIDRVVRKMSIHEETLVQNQDYGRYKVYGDLLNSQIYALPEYGKEARLVNYYEETMPEIVIPLDESKNVSQNAQRYFLRYKKGKAAYENALSLKENDLPELAYLRQVQVMLAQSEDEESVGEIRMELAQEGYLKERGKKDTAPKVSAPPSAFLGGKPASKKTLRERAAKAKSKQKGKSASGEPSQGETKPMRYTSPDGYRILVGRNNRQNDRLTLRDSRGEDLWFHVHGAPGAHVVLCTQEKQGVWSNLSIEMAASLAAWYSDQRNNSKADVDYTKIKHIKKIPGAHPGMVTYTHYKTITVVPKDGQQRESTSVS
ncbi:MAG: NFACT family protein [Clostridia bacterium]|nr:NFACT family protein [Clostridia bacterium]